MLHLGLCSCANLTFEKKKSDVIKQGFLASINRCIMQYRKECSLPCQGFFLVNYVLEFILFYKENTYTLSFGYFISLKQNREPTIFLKHLKVFPLSLLMEKAHNITSDQNVKGKWKPYAFPSPFLKKCPANCWQLVFNGKYQSSRIYT